MSSPQWTAINKPAWTAINQVPTSGPMTPANIAKKQLQSDCEVILAHGPDTLVHGWLLKVSGVFTNAEILEKVNEVSSQTPLTASLLTERLNRAITHAAAESGRSRESIKEELAAAKKANGVDTRTNEYRTQKANEGRAKRKSEKGATASDSDENKNEVKLEEDAEEDPLGDLEEMVRRDAEGSLEVDAEEPSREQPEDDPLGDLEEMSRRVEEGSL